jgi:hypothetical protein
MRQRTVKNNTRKSQRDSQIEVVTSWQHTEEVPPAFKRLMMLLLRERIGNGEKATERESNRPNY